MPAIGSPPYVIRRAVWLYFRFNLSFRDVEELLAYRGIEVSYEAIRKWCLKFGQQYCGELNDFYRVMELSIPQCIVLIRLILQANMSVEFYCAD